MSIDVDELAAALRAYVGPPLSPKTRDFARWYIDVNSDATDVELRELAEGIAGAVQRGGPYRHQVGCFGGEVVQLAPERFRCDSCGIMASVP